VDPLGSVFNSNVDEFGKPLTVTSPLADRVAYNAFGEVLIREGITRLDYLFTGEHRDPLMGLDYLRGR
jgi:hypothetical protein